MILAMISREFVLDLPAGADDDFEALVTIRPKGDLPMRVNPIKQRLRVSLI